MPRIVKDARLESRTARAKLKPRADPYYRALESGLHLGYRKGKASGKWVVRRRTGERYVVDTLPSIADDTQDPNGSTILDYAGAVAAARALHAQRTARNVGAAPYTVARACEAYKADYERRGGRGLRTVASAINAHIGPALGDLEVAELTTAQIRDWLHNLAAAPLLVRPKASGERKERKASRDAESRRRRQAAANRVFNVLQAALNFAFNQGKAPSDEAWRKVKRFRDVDAPVVRYLTEPECKRLVNACPGEFQQLVRAALLTGCRYSELTALRCGDFNPDGGMLAVRTSKSGKPRHVVLTDEAQGFFAEATAGRAGEAVIFERAIGQPWQPSDQRRPLAAACGVAKIKPSISFHVLRHTHGSLLAMHGVPLPVIAKQLGHADARMTERHYAHLAPSYIADTIRANFPTLDIVERGKVTLMQPRKRS